MLLVLVGCFGLEPVDKADGNDPSGGDTAAVGALQIDANALAFGDVELGSSATQDLTLSNTGDGALGVTLSVSGDGFSTSADTVSVDTSSFVTVRFQPATEGPYTGSLELALDSGDTLSIPLSGNGVEEGGGGDTDTDTDEPTTGGPNIGASPTRYDFGRVDVDDTVRTTFVVTNNGDEDLLISDVVASDRVFVTSGTLSPPQVLSPGSSKLVDVDFTPTAETAYSGTITLVSDDPDTPELAIAVEGEGVNLCDICSPLIDVDTGGSDPNAISDFFYTSFTGADSRTVTIRNYGDQDLEVTNISVNNDLLFTAGTFSVGGFSGPMTIPPSGQDTFNITFRASDSGIEVGQAAIDMNVVHVISNDPSAGDWVIELSGVSL